MFADMQIDVVGGEGGEKNNSNRPAQNFVFCENAYLLLGNK